MELDRRAYWIWLQHALQAGSSKPRHILESFGSIEDFYRAGRQEWGLLGIFTQRELSAMREYPLQEAQAQLAYCAQMGQTVLTPEDGEYPFLLRQIHNPPAVLYVQGELPDFAEVPAISIVGTRKATLVGKRVAHSLGYGLAKGGAVVVSGGALGIDTAAHKGALLAGGKTVCVLGCGIDYPYLAANTSLREAISHSGALLSEYPPGTPALRNHFPIRNPADFRTVRRDGGGGGCGKERVFAHREQCDPPKPRRLCRARPGREPYVPRAQQPFARGNESGQLCKRHFGGISFPVSRKNPLGGIGGKCYADKGRTAGAETCACLQGGAGRPFRRRLCAVPGAFQRAACLG